MNSRSFAMVGLVPIFMASAAMSGVIWDEDIDGSLSTDRFNTTDFGTLSVGSNNMICDTQSGISKFFTFTIAEGNTLGAAILDNWIPLFVRESRSRTQTVKIVAPARHRLGHFCHVCY